MILLKKKVNKCTNSCDVEDVEVLLLVFSVSLVGRLVVLLHDGDITTVTVYFLLLLLSVYHPRLLLHSLCRLHLDGLFKTPGPAMHP